MAAERMNMSSVSTAGRLVPFPLAGRTAFIRRCAAELENTHGDDAVQYWRNKCRALADQLLSLGCSEEQMRQQVAEFQHEVQAELMRRHWQDDMAGSHG